MRSSQCLPQGLQLQYKRQAAGGGTVLAIDLISRINNITDCSAVAFRVANFQAFSSRETFMLQLAELVAHAIDIDIGAASSICNCKYRLSSAMAIRYHSQLGRDPALNSPPTSRPALYAALTIER